MARFEKIILLGLFFLVSTELYSKCLPLDSKYGESSLKKILYYNLQGDSKGVSEVMNDVPDGYYKNYVMGYSYLVGKDVLKNYDLAEKFLIKSSAYCFSPAHYSLGYLYYIKKDVKEAEKWFVSARILGDNFAAHQLGVIYKKDRKYKEMLENFEFAASHDFTPSITELGVQFYDGVLVNKDIDKAFKYFERAALRNDVLAQNNLGWMYEHGEGVEKDIEKAKYWYQQAFDNGFEGAYLNIERLKLNLETKLYY